MSSQTSCRVYVDGVRLADGSPDDPGEVVPPVYSSPIRTNAFLDPRATSTSYWKTSVGAGGYAQTLLTGLTPPFADGPTTAVRSTCSTPTGTYHDARLSDATGTRTPVVEGRTYSFGLWARFSANVAQVTTYVQWANAAGSIISTITKSNDGAATANVWRAFKQEGLVAPAGAAFAWIIVRRIASIVQNDTVDATGGQIEAAATLGGYFDGSTPDVDPYLYDWTGVPDASTSIVRELVEPGHVIPNSPTALSGLSIAWGRSTTVDQPAASTCTFAVFDPPGGETAVGLLHTGALVRVEATGTAWPEGTVQTFTDPSFESGAAVVEGSGVRSQTRADAGTWAAFLASPKAPARSSFMVLLPAPRSSAPGAWDEIPTAVPGQTWVYRMRVWSGLAPVPPFSAQSVVVRPMSFTSPTDDKPRQITGPDQFESLVPGWQTIEGTFVVPDDVAGTWLGLHVGGTFNAPTWDSIDHALTWATLDPTLRWSELGGVYVDAVELLAPAAGLTRTVVVFEGRVTDVRVIHDDVVGPVLEATAVDFSADLDNRDVGDEPWLVEPMSTRFNRVLTLAGLDVSAIIDPAPGALLLSWQDIDSQPATQLLADFATSTDSILWPAVHASTGPYFYVEDAAVRQALWNIIETPDGIVRIIPAGGRELSACDVLRDPVAWVQSVADISTRVVVSWLEQTLDDEGNPAPTERTVTRVDAALENELGTRRMSVSTLLQSETNALSVADQLRARTGAGGWRVEGLTVDADDLPDVLLLLTLLDGTNRIGLPVRLVDLPAWAPVTDVPMYLEGGGYDFDDGRWVLDMTMSRAEGQGLSARWSDLETTWRWDQLDTTMTWDDLRGAVVAQEGA